MEFLTTGAYCLDSKVARLDGLIYGGELFCSSKTLSLTETAPIFYALPGKIPNDFALCFTWIADCGKFSIDSPVLFKPSGKLASAV